MKHFRAAVAGLATLTALATPALAFPGLAASAAASSSSSAAADRTLTLTGTGTKMWQVGRPGAMVKASGARYYTGNNVYGPASKQTVRATVGRVWSKQRATVRITNDASATDRYTVVGSNGDARFRVRYLRGGRDVTSEVMAGTLKSPWLRKGQEWTLTVEVSRRPGARRGNYRTFIVRATSRYDVRTTDSAGFRVSAR